MLTYPGQTAVFTRSLAWNVAGEVLTDADGMKASEALRLGGLADWNVRHVPVVTGLGDHAGAFDDAGVTLPDHRAVVATIGGQTVPLGVVGTKHTLFQNEETTEMLDTIVDDSGAHFVAAGSLKNNRKTFVVMKMPSGIQIGGEDAHDLYFGCTNSHDGSGSLIAWTTTVRLVCTNMLNSSIRGAKSSWRLRHTSSIRGKVEEARQSLDMTFAWAAEFEAAAQRMLETSMSDTEFDAIVDALAPLSESDKAGWVARSEAKRATLRHLFHEAETNEFGRGTRWAAYNAFTEYGDWFLPIRSADPRARGQRILGDETVGNWKQAAFDLLAVPA
jgi:phage/plasmid-like protein (TIGR03299 family)